MGIEDKTLLCFCHWGRINKVLPDGLISYKGGTTDHVIAKMGIKYDDFVNAVFDRSGIDPSNKMLYFTVKFDRFSRYRLYTQTEGGQNIPLKAWLKQRNLLNQGTSRMTTGSNGFPCTQTGSQQDAAMTKVACESRKRFRKQTVELSESDDTSISVETEDAEIENGNSPPAGLSNTTKVQLKPLYRSTIQLTPHPDGLSNTNEIK
uniref:Uncharacterized protein n=1 Tax=Solanum tuberosum TaxID=4113 RepID=M1C3N4_SOLTU